MTALGHELTDYECGQLDDVHDWAVQQFGLYRRRGLDREAAFKAALAWGRNRTEQRARRLAHETGATA